MVQHLYDWFAILQLLPVLVWIHGGGHSTGAASLDQYDGQQLVSSGNIVFVAIQYRLGPLGFMYLGERSGIPGNMGLLDQVKALDWISQNIQTFNGNPDEVTLMGESSGAHSVALHMISPKSEGLFQKAILHSSGLNPSWGYQAPKNALENARALLFAFHKANCLTFNDTFMFQATWVRC